MAATVAVAMALLSPILAAGAALATPSIPPWGSPMSLSPGVLQRQSGHTGLGLLLADSVCPQRARTRGPRTLGLKLVPAGALRQHQELG